MDTSLSPSEFHIVNAAAFAAKGDQRSLRQALEAGLDAGVSINEFKEILVQLYAYCGFPRSLNALQTLRKLVDARGGKDSEGPQPTPFPKTDMLALGDANQTKLIGREIKGGLFDFAPAIDEYLKSHLFGDIFARDNVSWKVREMATVAMLAARHNVDAQLKGHISIAKNNGVSDEQIEDIVSIARGGQGGAPRTGVFPTGEPNTAYAGYFSGKSWLAALTRDGSLNTSIANVTFEPGCRNNWHSHSGGQILIGTGGSGWYQERGKQAIRILPGTVVEIPQNAEHWHGAAPDSWFSHLAITCNPETNKSTWLEPVSDEDYQAATARRPK